jgi:limonene-1,2-epoxide hydrolase
MKDSAMPSPTETVLAFFKRGEEPGAYKQAFRDYFTPTTVWENAGFVTTGFEEALSLIAASPIGMSAVRTEVLAVAETDNKVLTERIDHVLGADGKVVYSLPVMGIFEVTDGRFTAWRDYFDTAFFSKLGQDAP